MLTVHDIVDTPTLLDLRIYLRFSDNIQVENYKWLLPYSRVGHAGVKIEVQCLYIVTRVEFICCIDGNRCIYADDHVRD